MFRAILSRTIVITASVIVTEEGEIKKVQFRDVKVTTASKMLEGNLLHIPIPGLFVSNMLPEYGATTTEYRKNSADSHHTTFLINQVETVRGRSTCFLR